MRNIDTIGFKEELTEEEKDIIKKQFTSILQNIKIKNIFFDHKHNQINIIHENDTISTWLDEINVIVTINMLRKEIKRLKEELNPKINDIIDVLEREK